MHGDAVQKNKKRYFQQPNHSTTATAHSYNKSRIQLLKDNKYLNMLLDELSLASILKKNHPSFLGTSVEPVVPPQLSFNKKPL
jgi:hypothetical protein